MRDTGKDIFAELREMRATVTECSEIAREILAGYKERSIQPKPKKILPKGWSIIKGNGNAARYEVAK